MEKIFALMMIGGAFMFLFGGIASANSIEANESKTVEKILTTICAIGATSLLIGGVCSIVYILTT